MNRRTGARKPCPECDGEGLTSTDDILTGARVEECNLCWGIGSLPRKVLNVETGGLL